MRKQLFTLLCLVLLVSLFGAVASAQGTTGQVRFVHVVPGAPAIDVYTDGSLTYTDLAFGEASPYINLAPGSYTLRVTAADASDTLWEQSVTAVAGTPLTLVASAASAPTFDVYPDNIDPVTFGQARLTAVHAIEGGPAVDVVLADGRPVLPGLTYGTPIGTLDVPVFSYDLTVVPGGGALEDAIFAQPFSVPLFSGTSNMAVVYGSVESPEVLLLRTGAQATANDVQVRFAHAAPGAGSVDIYLSDTLIAPSVPFGADTGYLPIPASNYDVAIRAEGTTDDVISANVDVAPDAGFVTAAALIGGDTPTLGLLSDAAADATVASAVLKVFNPTNPENLSVVVDEFPVIVDVAAGTSGTTTLEPAASTLTAVVGAAEFPLSVTDVYGGVYYSAIALDGELVELQPASIAIGLGSAPGGDAAPIEQPQIALDVTPAPPVALPTDVPQVAAPTAVPQVVPATEAPVAAPAVPVSETGVTGRVVLDPGANLQLRQYPRADALSLGLAPSGSIFQVNGRDGAPAQPVDGVIDPEIEAEIEAYVDPVEDLEEDEDLNPEQTWLNITYNTPDGGQIRAWVSSQFVDIRDDELEPVRLADLDPVPNNDFGEAINTDITPPPVPENIVTLRVTNLDAGVNLNIRRTPNTGAEVIARVPGNTVLENVGFIEGDADSDLENAQAAEWAFIRYNPPQGGEVTGWVSTRFVDVLYRDAPVELLELDQRGELDFEPATTRGELAAGAAPPALPTVDPLADAIIATVVIDPGANLQFRRNPDANAEAIGRIPSGAQLIVSERTQDSLWLNVTFDGQTGWVASQFVTLAFNGLPFNLEDVTPVAAPAAAG